MLVIQNCLANKMLVIQNCTASFTFTKDELSNATFILLAQNGINTEYDPNRFHAIIMRLPLTTTQNNHRHIAALIFKSGRVVVTGLTHMDLAASVAAKIIKRLRTSLIWAGIKNLNISLMDLCITNVVGSYQHFQPLAIERIYQYLRSLNVPLGTLMVKSIHYDPTIFPALRFKLFNQFYTATCLVYINGQTIVTGVSDPHSHFFEIFQHLFKLFTDFPR